MTAKINRWVDSFTKDKLNQEEHAPVAGLALANKTSLLFYFMELFRVFANKSRYKKPYALLR